MAEQALNCVLIFICTHTTMRTHMRTTAKHPLLLLLLYTDVNYQNEQNMFNVIDATRPMHAIYLACRVSLLGLALLLGFALLLGTSFSAASHWPGGTPSQEPVLNPHAHQRCRWSEVVVGKRPSAIISFASCHTSSGTSPRGVGSIFDFEKKTSMRPLRGRPLRGAVGFVFNFEKKMLWTLAR